MKRINLWYWIFTGIVAALMTMSAIPDLLVTEEAVVFFRHLGYPTYLLPFLGVAKLLGVLALLLPRFRLITEWAYAGFIFDLLGAAYSGIMVKDPMGGTVFQFICLAFVVSSFYFYRRRLSNTEVISDASQPAI